MPRAARGRSRLSRILFRALWRPWRWVGVRRKTIQARERVLAGAAPFFFLLLVGWVSFALLGCALILWSPAFVDGIERGGDSFSDALYVAGSSLFTLGSAATSRGDASRRGGRGERARAVRRGDRVPPGAVPGLQPPRGRRAAARRGPGLLRLVPELLHRMGERGVASSLPDLFAEWERWVADVLETHMSYPLLAVFRSPHDNTSWTSLGSVLDAATLIITSVDDEPDERAAPVRDGVHAVEDLFYYLRLTEREAVIQRDEFQDVLDDMRRTASWFVPSTRPMNDLRRSGRSTRRGWTRSPCCWPRPGSVDRRPPFLGARTSHRGARGQRPLRAELPHPLEAAGVPRSARGRPCRSTGRPRVSARGASPTRAACGCAR